MAPAGAGAANAPLVPAGHDLLETDPQRTFVVFGGPTTIPPGFFYPGSNPFSGQVYFTGLPIKNFDPPPPGGANYSTGDADTIVRRTAAMKFSGPYPETQGVPIELVALQLRSVEPITVTGTAPHERWQVDITPQAAPPSNGTMSATAQSPRGGTFNSTLNVSPLLTFTRISDGAVRTLGAPTFNFVASGVKWRAGCIAPALRRNGLNDGFCPGLTPGGIKVAAIHQASNPSPAQHTVYPAQEALEHFKCYTLASAPFPTPTVRLTDQFQVKNHQLLARSELCNPARKKNEPWINRTAHLQCYRIGGAPLGQVRPVHNQLGSQRLQIDRPQRLCAISQKRQLPGGSFQAIQPRFVIDHFKCYGVTPVGPLEKPPPPITQVKLEDQFHIETGVLIGPPVRLCAPVRKVHNSVVTPIRHPVQHLVCYAINQPPFGIGIEILNQFELQQLQTIRPVQLCVPTAKGIP